MMLKSFASQVVGLSTSALLSVSGAATGATVRSATVGTQPREIVHNAQAARPFIDAAAARRVDIAGIGDSNQVAGPGNNYGWDHGYGKAWITRFGEYGTGVGGMAQEGAWATGVGYIDSFGSPYGSANSGAPQALHQYKLFFDSQPDITNDFPASYAYYSADFREATNHWQPSTTIRQASPLWGRELTWHLTYGTFAKLSEGGFTPNASISTQKIASGPRINTTTGTYALADTSLSVPASAYVNRGQSQMHFAISHTGEGTVNGPFFGLWQRVISDRTSGVAYSTTLGQGGRALVHAATALQTQSNLALKEYVRNMVRHQGGEPMLLVNVNHGGNDGGSTQLSVGPNPAVSSTPAGFADNMEAVIQRYRAIWEELNYDPKNLVFQYGPYHPADGEAGDGTPRSKVQRLSDWEDAVINLSNQHPEYNLTVVRGSRLTTPETMTANQWYSSTTDDAHLSIAGYESVSELGVRQLVGYATRDKIGNASSITSLSFAFDSDVAAALTPDDLVLRELDKDTLISPFDLAVSWDAASKTATWWFQGLPLGELPAGRYEARISSSLLGTGARGGEDADYVYHFTADAVPEPTGAALMGVGAMLLLRRRR